MIVIKEGKIPELEVQKYGLFYRGKCEKCDCEFEAHESEFYEDTINSYEPTISIAIAGYRAKEKNLYIDCPTCKKKIKIKNLESTIETELWRDNPNKYLE